MLFEELQVEITDSSDVESLEQVSHTVAGAQLRYVVPIIRWGETIQQELSEGWSRIIQHDLTGKLDDHR